MRKLGPHLVSKCMGPVTIMEIMVKRKLICPL